METESRDADLGVNICRLRTRYWTHPTFDTEGWMKSRTWMIRNGAALGCVMDVAFRVRGSRRPVTGW